MSDLCKSLFWVRPTAYICNREVYAIPITPTYKKSSDRDEYFCPVCNLAGTKSRVSKSSGKCNFCGVNLIWDNPVDEDGKPNCDTCLWQDKLFGCPYDTKEECHGCCSWESKWTPKQGHTKYE